MGSADCQYAYQWSPHKKDLPKLENVFPHMPEVYGGARIIAASKLKKAHDVHEWVDGWDESLSEDQTKAKEIWLSTVPFVEIGNGDYLGLHVSPDQSSSPVVYLCHDDEECPVTTISPSFDTFLADWETLYYIGPEIWMLGDFLDNEGAGPLNVEQEKTLAWRELVGKGKW